VDSFYRVCLLRRLAGVLMDFALLGISIVMLVVCWYRPYKAKK
jgi:hypothetical protein